MKVKIEDNERKEKCGVYFDVKQAANPEGVSLKMDVPKNIL